MERREDAGVPEGVATTRDVSGLLALLRGSLVSALSRAPFVSLAGVIVFCAYAWWRRIDDLALQIAWHGFSPLEYVYRSFHPGQFGNNFSSGIELYDASAFMWVYKLAYGILGVTPEALLPAIVAVEFAVMAWAAWAVTRALRPDASPFVAALVTVLVVGSHARDMNVARFAQPFFWGLYYNVGDALRLFAVVQFLRCRPIAGAGLLAGCWITHPALGLMGGMFVLAMLLVTPRELLRGRAIAGGLVFLLVAGTWTLGIARASGATGGVVPAADWFAVTRLNSSHWYPVEWGVLTTDHQRQVVPFLSFLLLLLFYLRRPSRDEAERRMLAGFVAMLLLVVLGVAISVWTPSPTLVKLALHRANDLILLFGLVYVTHGLWGEVEAGPAWRRVAALVLLVSPFVAHPGYPLAVTLLLVAPAAIAVARGRGAPGDGAIACLGLAVIGLLAGYGLTGILGPWDSDAYTWGASLRRLGTRFGPGLGAVALAVVIVASRASARAVRVVGVAAVALAALLWVEGQGLGSDRPVMADYRAAQLWAREHTPAGALFMTDPGIYYGWRDYSRRGSFGNLREWLYTSWLYDGNVARFREGLRRFREFGLPLDTYTRMSPPPEAFRQLHQAVRERYYGADDAWRLELARRHGISYFVLMKAHLSRPTRLSVAYENQRFVILAVQ